QRNPRLPEGCTRQTQALISKGMIMRGRHGILVRPAAAARLLLVALLAAALPALAAQPEPGGGKVVSAAPADPQDAKKDEPGKGAGPDADEQYRRETERVVGGIELEILSGDKWVKVERIDRPLLFYGDATRENDRGSVWGWGARGRPVALLELFQNVNDRERW